MLSLLAAFLRALIPLILSMHLVSVPSPGPFSTMSSIFLTKTFVLDVFDLGMIEMVIGSGMFLAICLEPYIIAPGLIFLLYQSEALFPLSVFYTG